MANRKLSLAVLAIALILGMTMIGCEEPVEVDKDLNGTWVDSYGDELKLNNGDFEFVGGAKGTYTTSGGKTTQKITHVYDEETSKWISVNDYLKSMKEEDGYAEFSAEEKKEYDEFFAAMLTQESEYTLSADGKTLTLKTTYSDGDTDTTVYTRKS